MEQVQIWMLTGLLTVLIGLLAWIGKISFSGLMKKLDQMITELRQLNISELQIRNDLKRTQDCVDSHKDQLRDHEKRITHLERKPFIPHPKR